MKAFITCLCAAALTCSGTLVSVAQDKSTASKQSKEVQQETKTSTGRGTAKTTADIVNGRVESYDPGKSLKVTVPGKIVSTKSWDLDNKDWTYHVVPNMKAGEWVRVSEKTDTNGHKTLTVQHSTNKSHGTSSNSSQ
jgi:ABC-type oligopeptide transport system substrate-binding subunit